MCSPTAAVVGGGAVLGAAAAQEEAIARNKAIRYNAYIKEKDAQYAELQAGQAEVRGVTDVKRHRERVEVFKGEQRAEFSASGAVVDEGSTLDVLLDTSALGELDAMTIKRNAELEAFGFRFQAEQARREKELSLQQIRDPNDVFFNSLLTGGSQVGATYALSGRK